MKKIALLFFCCLNLVSVADSSKIDSLNRVKIGLLNEENQKLKTEITVITCEIQKYKTKEDFYVTALSNQATEFELIVVGLLAVAGFFSWTFFKKEIRRIRKKVSEINDRVEKSISKTEIEFQRLSIEFKFVQAMLSLTNIKMIQDKKLSNINNHVIEFLHSILFIENLVGVINSNRNLPEEYRLLNTKAENEQIQLINEIKDTIINILQSDNYSCGIPKEVLKKAIEVGNVIERLKKSLNLNSVSELTECLAAIFNELGKYNTTQI